MIQDKTQADLPWETGDIERPAMWRTQLMSVTSPCLVNQLLAGGSRFGHCPSAWRFLVEIAVLETHAGEEIDEETMAGIEAGRDAAPAPRLFRLEAPIIH